MKQKNDKYKKSDKKLSLHSSDSTLARQSARQRPLSVDGQVQITGIIQEIIFRNEENGYTVCTLSEQQPTSGETTTLIGTMPFLNPGESAVFTGQWTDHPIYGRQMIVKQYELIAPENEKAILHYLQSGLIKGIGPKTARRLVDAFGRQTLDVLRNQPQKTAGIRGISRAKAQDFASQLAEKEKYQDLMLLLSPLGIGTGTIMKIFRQYGSDALDILSKNPYMLADDVQGIGFLTADRLARDLGLDPKSSARVAGAVMYVMNQAGQQGHTALPARLCQEQVAALLNFQPEQFDQVMQSLYSDDKLILLNQIDLPTEEQETSSLIALPAPFLAESRAARALLNHMQTAVRDFPSFASEEKIKNAIQKICQEERMSLAAEQETGIVQALRHPVSILTGGPGTGKTTVIKILCRAVEEAGGRVVLAAPTGRAAKRMQESSGFAASTIHRLLSLQIQQTLDLDTDINEKIACDLLVIDETSMLDVFLLNSLTAALAAGTRLVLTGDADQLPSVGPGYVLKDLIDSQLIPVTRLSKIFRQSEESLIIKNAHRIHDGLWPEVDQSFHSQFIVVYKEQISEMAAAATTLCTNILPRQYGLDAVQDVQVLTPTRKGPAGCQILNENLQAALNPVEKDMTGGTVRPVSHAVDYRGQKFLKSDKVMQIRNDYELTWFMKDQPGQTGKGVFNGETGTIMAVYQDPDRIEVRFDDDRIVDYDKNVLDELELAYAVTVHKSQGSEYPVVVLLLPPGAPKLLTRNLLYTAVTRARNKLILITSRKTLRATLANDTENKRYTLLRHWLAE